jgi:hypothetical protein
VGPLERPEDATTLERGSDEVVLERGFDGLLNVENDNADRITSFPRSSVGMQPRTLQRPSDRMTNHVPTTEP